MHFDGKCSIVRICKNLGERLEKDAVSLFEIKLEKPAKPNTLLLRLRYLSLDPYIHNRMSFGRTKYIPSLRAGDSVEGMAFAEVQWSFFLYY